MLSYLNRQRNLQIMTDKTLSEVLYDDENLGNYSLSDICSGKISYDIGDEPEKWCFVRAQTGDRGVMIKSRGVYVVLRTKKYDRLIENLDTEGKETNHFKMSEIVDAMPRKERRSKVAPSIKGEYLTVKEVQGYENSDGRIDIQKSSGFTSDIPVEYVIEPLSYDEVVVELIDQSI